MFECSGLKTSAFPDATCDDVYTAEETNEWGIETQGYFTNEVLFTASLPLLHLDFRGLEKGPFLFGFTLPFSLEVPPTIHSAVSRFLRIQK